MIRNGSIKHKTSKPYLVNKVINSHTPYTRSIYTLTYKKFYLNTNCDLTIESCEATATNGCF